MTGASGSCDLGSGTQECGGLAIGGLCSAFDGSFGIGGDSCAHQGGGGGWYGAAGGDTILSGGGGSGYISPFANSGSFPGGTQKGDGKVIITT